MSGFQDLKDFFRRRLLTVGNAELAGETSRYEEELQRRKKQLDVILIPEIKLHRADDQQLLVCKEEFPPEQQERSPSLDQEDTEYPHIKEEPEELWSSQEGEQPKGLKEADTTKLLSTTVSVKSDNDEEEPQPFLQNQRPAEQMGTVADKEDCEGLDVARTSDTEGRIQPEMKTENSSEPETDDSDDWKETRGHHLGLKSVINTQDKRPEADEKLHSCFDCGKTFRSKLTLSRHMRIHTGEKPYRCHTCGQSFYWDSQLRRHKCALVHTSELNQYQHAEKSVSAIRKNSVYPESSRNSDEESYLKPDTEVVTENSECWEKTFEHKQKNPKKSHSCSFCGKILRGKWHMTQHIRTHTGEKPYSCSVCGKRFYQKVHLIPHSLVHSGEKPFSCSVCGKRFSQKYYLILHMAHHKGEKPISCSVCDQRFSWYSQLKKHKCIGGQASELYENRTHEAETGADDEDCRGPEPTDLGQD